MAKMKFPMRVKYKEAYQDGLVPFEVDAVDVQRLQGLGGVLLTSAQAPEQETEPQAEAPEEGKRKNKRS